jgi:hypothetical protein
MITLYPNEQSRRRVLSACQSGTVAIGWALRGVRGYLFNPSALTNQLGVVPNVVDCLNAIGGDALLIRGNSGISATEGIFQDTINGMLADDYVQHLVFDGVTFTGSWIIG